MRIVNLNPDTAIGASAWLVEVDGRRILLDAGTHPKREGRAGLPLLQQVAREDVDAIAISHCHHDHVGALPVAIRHWPHAHVFLTELGYFLVERVLHNSVNVMKHKRREQGLTEYPLYSHDEVDEIAPLFQGLKYNREMEWAAYAALHTGRTSPTLEFLDAGHVMGSAGMMIRGEEASLFYTGDVCFGDQTLLKGACFEEVRADVMIMETTRGARATLKGHSRAREVERLVEAISAVLARRGSVLIPTFALGRTQEILGLLALLMQEGRLPRQPIYIGGLGRVFTEIYDIQAHRVRRQHPDLRLTESLNLVVLERGEAEKMKLTGGKIFVVTAGMMTENTAAHDLAARMIEEEQHAIFFVGYADPDTPGGRLKATLEGDTFPFSPMTGELVRRCEVQDFDLTAHANREELLDLVGRVGPKVVLLGHGDDDARAWFETEIRRRHPKVRVCQPGPGACVNG